MIDDIDKAAQQAVEATNLCTKHMKYHGQKYKSCTPQNRVIIKVGMTIKQQLKATLDDYFGMNLAVDGDLIYKLEGVFEQLVLEIIGKDDEADIRVGGADFNSPTVVIRNQLRAEQRKALRMLILGEEDK